MFCYDKTVDGFKMIQMDSCYHLIKTYWGFVVEYLELSFIVNTR